MPKKDSLPKESLLASRGVSIDTHRGELTLPMTSGVAGMWMVFAILSAVLPYLTLHAPRPTPPFVFYVTPLACLIGVYFAARARRNSTVFAFDAQTFTAVYGPWPPERTRFAMPIASIVSFDAEYGEQHEMGFVIKVLNLHGERIHVPARLLGVVTTLRGSSRYLSGKPSNALVLALAKELNNLLAESRERQRSFRS